MFCVTPCPLFHVPRSVSIVPCPRPQRSTHVLHLVFVLVVVVDVVVVVVVVVVELLLLVVWPPLLPVGMVWRETGALKSYYGGP